MTKYESGVLKRANICDICPACNMCTGGSVNQVNIIIVYARLYYIHIQRDCVNATSLQMQRYNFFRNNNERHTNLLEFTYVSLDQFKACSKSKIYLYLLFPGNEVHLCHSEYNSPKFVFATHL
jgi:hypothetical protein